MTYIEARESVSYNTVIISFCLAHLRYWYNTLQNISYEYHYHFSATVTVTLLKNKYTVHS